MIKLITIDNFNEDIELFKQGIDDIDKEHLMKVFSELNCVGLFCKKENNKPIKIVKVI